MNSFNPSDWIPYDQSKITDDILSISFDFERIPLNLGNGFKCCYVQCNNIPTYYLKSSNDNIVGRFCNSCKELHESYALDNYEINIHQKKERIKKAQTGEPTQQLLKEIQLESVVEIVTS